jgi:hypothetical protein
MIPYYLIDSAAPYPSAFAYVGYDWAKYIVSIGAIISLATWSVLKLIFIITSAEAEVIFLRVSKFVSSLL